MKLEDLKKDYNEKLARNKNAEEYFKTHTVKECMKYLKLFNKVTADLGELIIKYKELTGKEMSRKEILGGFEEV